MACSCLNIIVPTVVGYILFGIPSNMILSKFEGLRPMLQSKDHVTLWSI